MVRLCAAARAPIVPQGGNTSMVGGATPSEDGSEFVLSLSRMTRVRDIDPIDLTLTIEAGATLKAAQIAAADAGCLLPLSISSEGTAQIGGVLAANAGGNNTRALRQCARSRARAGGGAAGRRGVERPAPAAQGQHRLLPAPAVRRLGRNARHHHRRGAEARAAAARDLRGVLRHRLSRGGAGAVQPVPGARPRGRAGLRIHVRTGHRLRAEAHPRRDAAARPAGTALCAGGTRHAASRRRPARVAGGRSGAGTCRRPGAGCGDRGKRRAGHGDLAAARGALRGAETRGRQREERRFGAGVEGAGVHPPRDRCVRRR